MKQMFHKISAFGLALLLLASTTSWTVDKHFCMGHLMDVAFFTEADNCGMGMDEGIGDWTLDCCSDEVIVISGQDDLKVAYDELSVSEKIVFYTLVTSYIELLELTQEQIVPFDGYPPPLLVRDLQLLDEVFLI